METATSRPLLDGVRVVESSAFIAAPLAGMTLAQKGADVIRIDAIGGGIDYQRMPMAPEGRSLYWTGLNKGKRSFCVDIRNAEGRELVAALATTAGPGAGILLTNMGAPWLSHKVLAERRADVITCVIEGNPDGSTAVDYTVNCATGYPAMTGDGSLHAPVNHVLPAWDLACAYQAAFSISSALLKRTLTRNGSELRIALSDVAFATLSNLGLLAEAELFGEDRASTGNYLYGAFGRDFETRDGKRVYIAAISVGQWRNLIRACNLEPDVQSLATKLGLDFTQERDRFEAREAIASILERWCASLTAAEIQQQLADSGVLWGPYRTVLGALREDPRVSLNNPLFQSIETAGVGTHLAAGSPIREPDATASLTPAPILGQHTDEILLDTLGLGSHEVGRLHDSGIVAGPDKDPLCGQQSRR
jgi:2-methylfumaryl-CoA isomerase